MKHQPESPAPSGRVVGIFLAVFALVFTMGAAAQAQPAAAAAPKAPAAKAAAAPAAAQKAAAPAAAAKAAAVPAGLDQILKELASYEGGAESGAAARLHEYVQDVQAGKSPAAECETKLIAFLRTPAPPYARMAAARGLRLIAGDGAVAPLAAMLKDDKVNDAALYALARIPGAAAENALLQAMTTAVGGIKTSIIAVLGERRDQAAVSALVSLLGKPDTARASALALGAIGGDAATEALTKAFAGAAPDLKPVLAGTILQCAEKRLAAKNDAGALSLYESLAADGSLPVPVRKAAALGRISAGGAAAKGTLMTMLGGTDAVQQEAAISKIAGLVAPDDIGAVCALWPKVPERAQIQLLAVLSGYPAARVRPTVVAAAGSESLPVRLAAFGALAKVGDGTAVPGLVGTATKTKGPEQAAARATLAAISGRDVDEAVVSMLKAKPSDAVAVELLQTVSERRMFAAKDLIVDALKSPSAPVRTQALKSLRPLGTPTDAPAALDAMLATDDSQEQTEAATTAAALVRKMSNSAQAGSLVTRRLMQTKEPAAQAKLIEVLPLLGTSDAIPTLRRSIADANPEVRDAAVRALTSWPNSDVREDVFRLARDSRNETHRLLAIRGLIRIVGLDRFREPAAVVEDLRTVAGFTWRQEEQLLVLGALSQFPCQEGIAFAGTFAAEPGLKAQAEAAIQSIQQRMKSPMMMRRGR